jgi:hypothetical protein
MEGLEITTQPFEISDFKGGITDYFLGGRIDKYQWADNFLIIQYDDVGKLITRPGSQIYDSANPQIPAGAQRIGTLKLFEDTLFQHSSRKFYYISAGSFVTLQGPVTANEVFPSGVDTTTVVSMATWNGHLLVANSDFSKPQKIYKNGSSVWQLRTAGLPQVASNPTITPGTPGATLSYIYTFVLAYTYAVGTVTYIDRGPVRDVTVTANAAPNASTFAITAIPVLANGTTHNYDTATIKVEIYRTINGGQDFYKVGQVTNGTTTFNDTVSDTTLQANERLYTTGGVVENDEPLPCKIVHIVKDKAYYAHVKEGSEIHQSRVYQSIPGDIDAVPGDFYLDVDDPIVGMSSFKSLPILLGEGSAYRIDGEFDLQGRGGMIGVNISSTCSCVSSLSVVQTDLGVFWAGENGFYWTDGYNVLRVNRDTDKTYKNIVSSATRKRRILGKYDELKNRVYWTAQYESDASEVDFLFVLDLNWGISDQMAMTTWSGGANFRPTAIEFIDGNLIRADSRGYVFKHTDTVYTDPRVDTNVAASTWSTAAIIYDHISIATNFGTTFERKFVPRLTVVCDNETNLALQITSINDDGRRRGDLKPIRFRGNIVWGDDTPIWNDPDLIWNYEGLIDEWRRFPAQSLRCSYKQIEMTNAFVAILNSDLLGTGTVDAAAKTLNLDNASATWPTSIIDYYVAFERDGYVQEFAISAVNSDTLTYVDTHTLTHSAAGQNWVIRGYPKGEILSLQSYTYHYSVFGKSQQAFNKSSTGEVGAADD